MKCLFIRGAAPAALLSGMVLLFTCGSSVSIAQVASSPSTSPTVQAQGPAQPATQPMGHLALAVVVVDELTPKPVPLTDFAVTPLAPTGAPETVRTDAEGKAAIDLPPGHYKISSVHPSNFKDHAYTWAKEFDITAGQTLAFSWTDADAQSTTAATTPLHREVSEEAQVYNLLKNGVVTVEGDFGQGSGFVVDKAGLILTNQHVVNGGRWVAVRFERGIRVPAVIVEEDSAADVAAVAVNPALYHDYTVVPVADPSHDPLAVEGEKVLAIGNPLHQEKVLTTGIISKVEKDYLISDVNINHGNSGGPLLNMAGQAIGLTTFLDPGGNGPGISGIVPISKALPVLAQAEKDLPQVVLPPAEMLPDISQTPMPDSVLASATIKETQPDVIGGPKNFVTTMVTPLYLAAEDNMFNAGMTSEKARRVRKRDHNGVKDELAQQQAPSHFWERYALHTADPFVAIVCKPALQEKSASKWRGVIGAMAGLHIARQLEFRDDFWDMALYRGDTLVHPVFRQRDTVSALYGDEDVQVADTAYGGVYAYDPSVFEPSEPLILYVRRESDLNRWDIVHIDSKEQAKIWNEFRGYRAALPSGLSGTVIGLSAIVSTPPQAGSERPGSEFMARYVGESTTPDAMGIPGQLRTAATTTPVRGTAAVSQPLTTTVFVLKDGSTYSGHVVQHNSEDKFYIVKIDIGTKLIKESDIVSITTR